MKAKYELYRHAGEISYADWKARGIEVLIFDKDNTLTSYNQIALVPEVIEGMLRQNLADIYPEIGLVTNNDSLEHIQGFASVLEAALHVRVHAVSLAHGYRRKPFDEMGHAVANKFGVAPSECGVIGDRYFTDVRFGLKFGAGVIGLCEKVGDGDAKWVPQLRPIEAGVVAADLKIGRARAGTAVAL